MKQILLGVLLTSTVLMGCGNDESDSNSAGSTGEGGAAGMAGEQAPAMGPGCYSGPPNHMCDCSIAEADCAEPQIWTDTCPCGDANGGGGAPEGGAAGAEPTGGEGNACYSPRSHECDCEATEEACSESGGIWTDMCPCNGEGGEGHGHEGHGHGEEGHGEEGHEGHGHSEEGHGMSGEGSFGCYGVLPNHMCDCEMTEEACGEAGGIWTDMCRSC